VISCTSCGLEGYGLYCQSCGERRLGRVPDVEQEQKQSRTATPSPTSPGREVALAIIENLDSGEGWFEADSAWIDWYPYRLRVRVAWSDEPACARVEAAVTTHDHIDNQLLDLVNRINIAASGWCAALDEETGGLAFRTSLCEEDMDVFGGVYGANRLAAVAEHLAERIAAIGGERSSADHPRRGRRNTPDGWLSGLGTGVAREGAAALPTLLTPAEIQRIGTAFEQDLGAEFVAASNAMEWRLVSGAGECSLALAVQHHPDLGFGLRIALPCGRPVDPLETAANLNRQLRTAMADETVLGAYVAYGSVVSYTVFMPALEVEKWASGDIARAVRMAVRPARSQASPVNGFQVPTAGFDPHWTSLRVEPVQFAQTLSSSSPEDMWRTQREEPLLTWVYFNPASPTVCTLQVAHTLDEMVLLRLNYHPMYPSGEIIATGSRDDLMSAAEAYAADVKLMVSGGLPTFVLPNSTSVAAAFRAGLWSDGDEYDFERAVSLLTEFQGDPWAMVEVVMQGVRSPREQRLFDRNRSPEKWFESATNLTHVRGCTLALRSAWEASKHFALGDVDAADEVAKSIRQVTASRLRGGMSMIDERAEDNTLGLAPISWAEVRTTALGFLDTPGPETHEFRELADGVEWYTQGVRVQVSATRDVLGDRDVLVVDVRTEIAVLTDETVGLVLAEQMNTELPLSMFVVEDHKLTLRCRVLLSSTGRTLLPVVRTVALLQAYYAASAQYVIIASQNPEVRPANDGSPTQGLSRPVLQAELLDDGSAGEWFPTRWQKAKEQMTLSMQTTHHWPVGWGNSEVQHFNEMPPDVAVALLDPPDPLFATLGVGVSVIARVLPGVPGIEAWASRELLNQINLYMLQLNFSALGAMRADKGDLAGLRVQLWLPVAGFLDASHSNEVLGIALANAAIHTARAPFTAHQWLRGDEPS
jgi:hypothetical protein